MTLDEIAIKYGTDKSSAEHFYTKYYEAHFESLRNKPLNILEIGVDKGYSLKTWAEYFPNAKIYGLDIQEYPALGNRITTIVGSQNDPAVLKSIKETFDIIIDDGSHLNIDMLISFETLFPLLKEGGFYVVEDLHACYWRDRPVFMNRMKKLIDDVNSRGKRGIADINKFSKDSLYKKRGYMTWWEKSIEAIHLYPSIIFIKKNDSILEEYIPPSPPLIKKIIWKFKYEFKKLIRRF